MNVVGKYITIKPGDYQDYRKFSKIAASWEKKAVDKCEELRKKGIGGIELDLFDSCQSISKNLSKYFQEPNYSLDDEVYVCKDNEENVQGFLTFFTAGNYFCITALLTNPENIGSSLNLEPIRGVGHVLLGYAERRAVVLKKEWIKVFPLPSAEPFYKRRGYVKYFTDKRGYMHHFFPHLIKTTEKIQEEIGTMLKINVIL